MWHVRESRKQAITGFVLKQQTQDFTYIHPNSYMLSSDVHWADHSCLHLEIYRRGESQLLEGGKNCCDLCCFQDNQRHFDTISLLLFFLAGQ